MQTVAGWQVMAFVMVLRNGRMVKKGEESESDSSGCQNAHNEGGGVR